MRRAKLLLISAALLAAGCEVDQAKERSLYRKVLDIGPATRATTNPSTQPTTWPADKPLTLVDAMLLANNLNENLAIQGETYLQTMINRSRAVASFLPTVSGQAAYGMVGQNFPNQQSATFDADLLGQMTLFNGFQNYGRLKIADLTIQQQRYLLLQVQESLLLNVVTVYFDILQLEAQTKVLESSLEVQQEGLRQAREMLKAGLGKTFDVAQSEAQAAATQVDLLNAKAAARNARAALAFVTGLESADMPLKEVPIQEMPPDSRQQLIQLALTTRNDLLAAGKASLAARQNVEVAFGEYYPDVSINLRYFLERQSVPVTDKWDSFILLNVPLFDAGLIHADVRTAWSQYRQAILFQSLLHRQIVQDVSVTYWNYHTSIDRIIDLKVQVAAAELGATQTTESFRAGLATNLERLTSIQQYLNAQLQLTSETYKQRVYAAQLAQAVGKIRSLLEHAVAEQSTTAPTTRPTTEPATR